MNKEEKKQQQKRHRERGEATSSIESESDKEAEVGEYGFVYEFFVSEFVSLDEELRKVRFREEREKKRFIDQSQRFFLPDFFDQEE